EIEGRRIHPGATGRVPAENCLDVVDVADGALPNELPRLRESDRAAALAADLHDALVLLCRLDDPETLLDLVGHRFLAIDVLTGVAGIHDDFPVPVVRNGCDHAIDLLVVQQILVRARRRHGLARRLADDLVRERVAIVIEVAGRHALDAGKPHTGVQDAGAAHTDTDHAEADPVARGNRLHRRACRMRMQKIRRCGQYDAVLRRAAYEFTTGYFALIHTIPFVLIHETSLRSLPADST